MAVAAAAWIGAAAGWRGWLLVAALAVPVLVWGKRRAALVATALLLGVVSGGLAHTRHDATLQAAVPDGRVTMAVRVADDQHRGRPAVTLVRPEALLVGGSWQHWSGPQLALTEDQPSAQVGDRLVLTAAVAPGGRLVRGDPVAGVLRSVTVDIVQSAAEPWLIAGNAIRERVDTVLGPGRGSGLVSGFLIGDVSGVSRTDLDALRRSGLTHFVAVSGSNVALFLAGVWLVTAPVVRSIRMRAVVGIGALVVFVVATRWEPSVVRAAAMAGLVLAGAAAGLPFRPWVALSAAVTGLLVVSGQLAVDVGFQLSVAATAGVLVGVRLFSERRPRFLWGALGVSVGAQAAVVPLLLVHFGAVPLLSPVANVVAAPIVTAATAVGAIAVITSWAPLVGAASRLAELVLGIATLAARWPQLQWFGVLAVSGVAALSRIRRLRPALALVAVVAVALPVVVPRRPPAVPTATVLDVGQGDAILLEDPGGAVALVDAGSDPVTIAGALRSRRIDRVDLLVATHGDFDHVGGLEGLLEAVAVGVLWVPDHPDLGPVLSQVAAEARTRGIVVTVPVVGARATLGSIRIEVLGPRRRYLAQNDGSIVLWVAGGRTLLLPGDIEAVAQLELPDLRPDVLLVPHHGSATTDLRWLERTVGPLAVISVGDNTFGHPASEILDVLQGTSVRETRIDGDIVVSLR